MRKIISVILVLAMLISACACGGKKPEETETKTEPTPAAQETPAVQEPLPEDMIKEFSEAMKAFDIVKMDSFMADPSDDIDLEGDGDDAETDAMLDVCRDVAKDIKYTVKDSMVNGDTADVTVEYKFKDGGEMMLETLSEYFVQALTLAFTGGSEEEMEALLPEIMAEKVESVGFGDATQTVTYPCQKVNGEWKITEMPEDVTNVLTANLFKALEEFELEDSDLGDDDDVTGRGDSPLAFVTYTLDNETVYDDDICSVTFQSAEHDEWWTTDMPILIENKTADKSLNFYFSEVSVNGYAIDPYFNTDVPAAKKSVEELYFNDDPLEECGIESIDEIRFVLLVRETDDYWGDYLVEEEIVVYPTGLSASEITVPERRTTDSEIVLAETDEFAFVVLDYEIDDFWGFLVNVYMENKTDDALCFNWEDVSVNDFMADPYFGIEVPAHTRSYKQASFDEYTMEGTGLAYDDFEKIDLTLSILVGDTWDGEEIFNEAFTLEVK